MSRLDEQLDDEEKVHRRTSEQKAVRESELMRAAIVEREAWLLHEDIQRSRSRAVSVREKNSRLLAAYASDPSAGSARERGEAEMLVAAAEVYLDRLDKTLAPSIAAVQEAHAKVSQTRDLRPEPPVILPQSPSRGDGNASTSSPQVSDSKVLREQEAHGTRRTGEPLRVPSRTGDRQPTQDDGTGAPIQRQEGTPTRATKVAKQAAFAAAMRGQGR